MYLQKSQRTAAFETPQRRNEDDSEVMHYHDTSLSIESPEADISLVPQLPTPVIAPVDVSGLRRNLTLSTPERANKKRKADQLHGLQQSNEICKDPKTFMFRFLRCMTGIRHKDDLAIVDLVSQFRNNESRLETNGMQRQVNNYFDANKSPSKAPFLSIYNKIEKDFQISCHSHMLEYQKPSAFSPNPLTRLHRRLFLEDAMVLQEKFSDQYDLVLLLATSYDTFPSLQDRLGTILSNSKHLPITFGQIKYFPFRARLKSNPSFGKIGSTAYTISEVKKKVSTCRRCRKWRRNYGFFR